MGTLVTVPILVHAWLTWETGRALEAELERLRAAGEPLTMAEIAPPPVLDEENAALLYLQALPRLQARDRLSEAYWDLGTAKDSAERQSALQELGVLVDMNRDALDIAERAAKRPASRFPADYKRWDPIRFDPPLSDTSGLRRLAYLFCAQAALASADGDVEEAVQSCLTGMKIACHVMREPNLIFQLTSYAMQGLLLADLRRVLQEHQVPYGTCAAAFEELGKVDLGTHLQQTLRAGRAEGLATFDYFERRATDELASQYHPGTIPSPSRLTVMLYLSPLAEPVRRSERLQYLHFTDRFLALSQRPYREGHGPVSRLEDEMDPPPWPYLILPLAGVHTGVIVSRDRHQAGINAVRVALALEAYHGKYDAYPETFQALRDYPGWELPEDPFSGKDFAYRRQGEGFVLYTWGQDLDDDGGRQVPRPAPTDPPDGDLVWEFAR